MSHAATDSMGGHDTALDRQGKANLLSAATVTGDEVCNLKEEELGSIQDIMLELHTRQIWNPQQP